MNITKGTWEVHVHSHVDGEFWCSIGVNGRGPITDIVGAEGSKAEFYQPVAGMKYLVTPVEEQKANAHLIAAAPELLKACELTCIVCFRKKPDNCKDCAVQKAITKANKGLI